MMPFPLMLRRTHERERHDLLERHERSFQGLHQFVATVIAKQMELLKVRNGVLEVTAENARGWSDLLQQLRCPGCGSPHGEFQIVIPQRPGYGVDLEQSTLQRKCLACKERTWPVRAALSQKNMPTGKPGKK